MTTQTIPNAIESVDELEETLSRPTVGVIESLRDIDGDFILLGIGGKMGPTLARQLKRALDAAGKKNRVIGVSRFSSTETRDRLQSWGIETISADLLDRGALAALPGCKNVLYLAARKFGSTGDEPYTWAMNTYLPGMVAERYKDSRIVAFSTGNVYPLTPVVHGGSTEHDDTGPVGEYAQSCLGRERMFQHFSQKHGTCAAIIRLNYAVELRYGILLDIAQKVQRGLPIPLAMGSVNVIWQGDANAYALQAFNHCASPAEIINVTGPETLSVRKIASQFAEIFGTEPVFEGEESPNALLNDASKAFERFGYPAIPIRSLIQWTADWLTAEMPTHNKPTHYEEREGKF